MSNSIHQYMNLVLRVVCRYEHLADDVKELQQAGIIGLMKGMHFYLDAGQKKDIQQYLEKRIEDEIVSYLHDFHPDDVWDTLQLDDAVLLAADCLDSTKKQLLVLRYFEQKTAQEAAIEMGICCDKLSEMECEMLTEIRTYLRN